MKGTGLKTAALRGIALAVFSTLTLFVSYGAAPGAIPADRADDDGVVRILAIGNSFSEDAVEQYLWNLADAEGYEVVIGNMYISGCSLATHLKHATNDAGAYAYRKIVDGVRTGTNDVKLSEAITDEPWDYISFQQASPMSGVYSTFEASLPGLVEYVESLATNDGMRLVMHQTWAYAADSSHGGFANYGNDQMAMYEAIVEVYAAAAELAGIEILIPAGTAIQNGRTSSLGDTFCRDGYHLQPDYGRYTAACAWFETIFGGSVVGNSYVPENVTAHAATLAQRAAHAAVQAPGKITPIPD
jgi:hypothetical protein